MIPGQGNCSILPAARDDLREIAKFLGQRDTARAIKFLEAARDSMIKLADAPYLGSLRPQ